MTELIFAAAWVVMGVGTLFWQGRGVTPMTWGRLLVTVGLGAVAGPVVPVVLISVIFIGAEFWDKPVFKQRRPQ